MTDTLPDSVTRPLRPKPANDPTGLTPSPYVKDQRVPEKPPRCVETVDGHRCHLDHPHGAHHVTNDGKALIYWNRNGRIVHDLRQLVPCALCGTEFEKDPSYYRTEKMYCSKRCAGRAAHTRYRNKGTA